MSQHNPEIAAAIARVRQASAEMRLINAIYKLTMSSQSRPSRKSRKPHKSPHSPTLKTVPHMRD